MTTLSCHLREIRCAPELRFESFCLATCLAVCNDKSCCWVILQILDLAVAENTNIATINYGAVEQHQHVASRSNMHMHSHYKHAGQIPTCFGARAFRYVLATVRIAALAQGVRLHF